jgi:cytochrome c biogenesis protein CcmG, thiol:disulfide interchange protein DsbE
MRNKFYLIILFIFLSVCFIIFYKGLSNSNVYTPKVDQKKNIPNFKVKEFDSNIDLSFKEIFKKNHYYILNIWASWCVPCRTEHPLLMKLSNNPSIKLIGLNYKDNLKNAKKFINEFGNPYTQILVDSDGTLSIELGAYGVPETFLIDKERKIIKKFVGPINQEIVEKIEMITK